ncbi:MAG: YadA C-terminal domain-containing protein [Candidatus Micropelagos thuwalensis]
MRKIYLVFCLYLIVYFHPSEGWGDTYQIYMPSTMPGALSLAPSQFYIVNTDSRSTVSVDTSSYISSYDISNWSFASNDFVQVDGSSLDSGKSNPRIFQDLKGSSLTIRENRLITVRDKGPDGIKAGDPGDTGDDGENRTYDRLININTADGSITSQTLIASNLSDYNHAVTNGYEVVLEDKSATPDQLAVMELFQMTTYSENLTNSGSMAGDAIETQGSFSTTKITDAEGVSLFRQEDDGSIHIGENSVVIVDSPNSSSGNDMIYSSAADGSILQIGNIDSHQTIINGTLEVTGESSFQGIIDMEGNRITGLGTPQDPTDAVSKGYMDNALLGLPSKIYVDTVANNLADGIEDSNAMSAALAALPNTAPDAEAYCGGGIGSYGDAQAFSLGCASNINDNFAVNFGASKLSSSGASIGNRDFDDYSLKAGFIYKIGYKPSKSSKSNTAALETELYRQQASLRVIAEKENYKDTKIAEYEKRLAKLEDQLEELKVAMLAGNKEFASLAK